MLLVVGREHREEIKSFRDQDPWHAGEGVHQQSAPPEAGPAPAVLCRGPRGLQDWRADRHHLRRHVCTGQGS